MRPCRDASTRGLGGGLLGEGEPRKGSRRQAIRTAGHPGAPGDLSARGRTALAT